MRRPLCRRQRGFQLVELAIVLGILSILMMIAVPPIFQASAWVRVRLAAWEVVGVMRAARMYAVRHATHVGVKFHTGAGSAIYWTLHRDGDGDGVRTDDIRAGIDPAVGPPQRLDLGGTIRFGFPPGRAPRDPGDPRHRLTRLEDPIRFNRSDIASFGPLGESTPGSVYVTDGLARLAVVRVFGRTAKVKVLCYDEARETWQ